jgi:hypothetical protein
MRKADKTIGAVVFVGPPSGRPVDKVIAVVLCAMGVAALIVLTIFGRPK